MTEYLKNIGERAVAASRSLNLLSDEDKNRGLVAAAKALVENSRKITAANATDVANAERAGMSPALIDRLRLDDKRIKAKLKGLTPAQYRSQSFSTNIKNIL